MLKKYQVFVSSTYEDLHEERQAVMQALLEHKCIPAGMELFPAANEDQWTLIKRAIDDCDYYLVIIAGRYGSVGEKGDSYTQMEYEYAVDQRKPTIAFLHRDPGAIPASKTEQTAIGKRKLEKFRQLAQKKVVKYWSSPQELGSVVKSSIENLIASTPAVGWVRGKGDSEVQSVEAVESVKSRDDAKDRSHGGQADVRHNRQLVETPSYTEKNTARTTRINLNLSEKSRADLDRMAATAGCTLTELVRFGLMLAKFYYDSPLGEKLSVVKDGRVIKEILPPWGL